MSPQSPTSSRSSKCTKLRQTLTTLVTELRESSFFEIEVTSVVDKSLLRLKDRKIRQILCYGLGTFSNGIDVASRYQLALLMLIHEYLVKNDSQLNHPIEIYDPNFEQLDKDLLLSFHNPEFKLINDNEFCARQLETSNDDKGCVLVYMPHLDKYLYNNLLGANWDVDKLSCLVVLGNSFSEMIDNEPTSKCKLELHYMNSLVNNFSEPKSRASEQKRRRRKNGCEFSKENKEEVGVSEKALLEFEIDDSLFTHPDVFNSLSLHLFDSDWLKSKLGITTIEKYSLPGWSCVTTSCKTNEANDEDDKWFERC